MLLVMCISCCSTDVVSNVYLMLFYRCCFDDVVSHVVLQMLSVRREEPAEPRSGKRDDGLSQTRQRLVLWIHGKNVFELVMTKENFALCAFKILDPV